MVAEVGLGTTGPVASEVPGLPAAMVVRGLDLRLQGQRILQGLDFDIPVRGITALIGPSGAGKSSLLRCLNGLYSQWTGTVWLAGCDVRRWPGGGEALRRRLGLIAQQPCVFPRSIRANVVFGLRGFNRRRRSAAVLEASLRKAALWKEVKDRLAAPAEQLSIGQRQRLCVARALAVQPGLLLLDEPTASLDARSRQLLEQSLVQLSATIPMLWVTHDLEQAARLAARVIFICDGRIIEQGGGAAFFANPQQLESREFLRWSVCDCD